MSLCIKKYLLPLLIAIFCFSNTKASNIGGAEITYKWSHDSTFTIYYHFYRDCRGAAEPDTINICYVSFHGFPWGGNIVLNKMTIIPPGIANGTDIITTCPGRPTTCISDTSTIPGYREWIYHGSVTLPINDEYWMFSHTDTARPYQLMNMAPGNYNMYVEATLDSKNAPHNSSPYFTVKPSPYMCVNVPCTYNFGAFDDDDDSLSVEIIDPLTSNNICPIGSPIPFASYAFPPLHPLSFTSPFSLDNTTGQESFTPDIIGLSVLTFRIKEWRNIQGRWLQIGSIMRDMELDVHNCHVSPPVTTTIIGASSISGTIDACPATSISFCYDLKAMKTGDILTVKDNHKVLQGTSSVSYTGMFTDSIRGCFTWTPSAFDSGLKIYAVTVSDSSCSGIGVPVSSTIAIPIYVSPITHIFHSETDSICSGDSVHLVANGGGNFVWDVLPGGSPLSSLSCTTCKSTTVNPTVTTKYTVHSNNPISCGKNTDTVTVTVVSLLKPSVTVRMSSPIPMPHTPDTFIATAVNCGSSPIYKWYRNGNLITGATTNTYIAQPPGNLVKGDIIKVIVTSSLSCAFPKITIANAYTLSITSLSNNTNTINIYPNPNDGSFIINAQLNANTTKATIEIINSVGQLVYKDASTISNSQLNEQLHLQNKLADGFYLLKIQSGEQNYISRFIVKQQ